MAVLDMTGKPCPIPVIEAKKALKSALPGDTVSVKVDNDIARQNLQKMAGDLGHGFSYEATGDGCVLASITVAESCRMVSDDAGGLVVAIGHDAMGGPGEELGKTLMKSFIYSLTEQDAPPEQILFYNGGVHLTTEGSGALDDLKTLADRGTGISSCGACLNYFQLSDKLAIGNVTNMYAIVSVMAGAKKLIDL